MVASKRQNSPPINRTGANNAANQITVEAQSVITSADLKRTGSYKDLSTVIYIWGENPAAKAPDDTSAAVKEDWLPAVYRHISDVRITSVSCAKTYLMLLSSCRRLFALGRGDYGQLGLGQQVRFVGEPTAVPIPHQIKSVVCAKNHCGAIDVGGKLYTWGRSDLAGHPDGFATCSPTELKLNNGHSTCRSIGVNDTLTVCVLDGGESLYQWGITFSGEEVFEPHLFYSFEYEHIRQVALGRNFGIALSDTGSVFGWGDRTYGETMTSGNIMEFSYSLLPRRLRHPNLKSIVSIATGERHVLMIDDIGRIWSMGENMYGQCGVPPEHHCGPCKVEVEDTAFPIEYIACGPRHSACINAGHQLYTWGHSSGHKLIFTTSVDMLVKQQRQPGVSVQSGVQTCCCKPQLIYNTLHEKVACVGLAMDYTVAVTGEGIVSPGPQMIDSDRSS
ncbi:Regulator of chromosome condensation (RCC1) repeat family protein [Babesia bovis T2Bo]|uniref:Regulator of chromosome condensation (RCC1) repeat family protein n=1 Tax=Babesia bovis T2Bo TaxID=484906 RepID=UPI001DB376FA|nr:Regulator of chromosome condensation (RCC1) repeat family protein [Babesia bovis T2Bo]EDO07421.2 Regulator of chromosome condensation (RCC1) repeat family protein [Babesia bovis T2Bo]